MRFLKILSTKSLAVALALALAPATLPAGTPLLGASPASAQVYGGNVVLAAGHFRGGHRFYRGGRGHYRGGRGYYGGRRSYGGRRYYGHRRHRGIGPGGAAVLGGIVGLGVGAAIASQPRYVRPGVVYGAPAYRSRAWYNYCASKYRSFDPRSGTFQPYNGPRQVCR